MTKIFKTKKIVIIEDEQKHHDFIKNMMKNRRFASGFNLDCPSDILAYNNIFPLEKGLSDGAVIWCKDGISAQQFFEHYLSSAEEFIIFMDYELDIKNAPKNMPTPNGGDVTEKLVSLLKNRLNQNESVPHINIVFSSSVLSYNDEMEEKIKGFNALAANYGIQIPTTKISKTFFKPHLPGAMGKVKRDFDTFDQNFSIDDKEICQSNQEAFDSQISPPCTPIEESPTVSKETDRTYSGSFSTLFASPNDECYALSPAVSQRSNSVTGPVTPHEEDSVHFISLSMSYPPYTRS